MKRTFVAVVAAGLLAPLGCGGTGGALDDTGVAAEALTGPTVVANMSPAGLVESTGNLYWTRNIITGPFPFRWQGRVYRAAKTNVPGQETVLYSESGSLGSSFSNIAFANDHGVWYGYFIANYKTSGTYIKRVPLDGSSGAVNIGPYPGIASANSPLLSDGTYLYFYGSDAIYQMPLDGSAAYYVARVNYITAFALDTQHVYFAQGNTQQNTGGPVYAAYKPNNYNQVYSVIATTSLPVTAMATHPGANGNDANTAVYWSAGPSIYRYKQASGASLFSSASGAGLGYPTTTTSLSFDGTNVDWTWSDTNSNCWVAYKYSADFSLGYGTLTYVGTNGARSVMGDASQIFYVDNAALERLHY
jgi:hypothetical protein